MLESSALKENGDICEGNSELKKIYHFLLEERNQVLKSVDYELKNYFTLIMSNVQLMETNNEDLLDNSHWLQMVGDIKKLYELMEQFSLYTTCDAIELKPADIQLLVQDVFQQFRAVSIMKELDLKLEIADNAKKICKMYVTNCNKLREILVNLVKNATETAKSGGEIKVAIEKDKEDVLKISIMNNRTSMEIEQKEEISDSKYISEKGIAGLNLSICAKFAAILGGKIEVDSTQQETSFQVFLPITK